MALTSDIVNTLPTFVIAEAGVNHNGDVERALTMVDAAAQTGADAIKFQTFMASELVTATAVKADYQRQTTDPAETQLQMLQSLELGMDDFARLMDRCAARDIEFISTPFDPISLARLTALGVRRLKIASGDLTNAPLLVQFARTGLPLILSTGMGTLAEVEGALAAIAWAFQHPDIASTPEDPAFREERQGLQSNARLGQEVTVLHCTTEYPAPFAEINLRAMDTLGQAFGCAVGYSDHTVGIEVAIAAVARGATVIEKHFTLDRSLPGPDHAASITPDEFSAMTRSIRNVETALGSSTKTPGASEFRNAPIARKSLVATAEIAAGERFSTANLGAKRPGKSLSPTRYWQLLGTMAERSYLPGEMIRPGELNDA